MLGLEQLKRLKAEFEALPSRVPSRTLMEIAGYPHYENVCSNILAFYLDPAAEHELNDLFLLALLDCLGLDLESPIREAEVGREVYSKQKGRLDLLIESGEFVIGIENKIWAGLGNDLDDYRELISSRAASKEIDSDSTEFVVLSLHPQSAATLKQLDAAGFRNLTYPELIKSARARLGQYIADSNLKFSSFFTDFLQTIENLMGHQDDSETASFYTKNGALLEELSNSYLSFRNRKAPALMVLSKPWLEKNLGEDDFKQSIWQKTTLVTHIRAKGEHWKKAISIDLTYGSGEWMLRLASRSYADYKPSEECHSFFKNLMAPLLFRFGDGWESQAEALS